MKKINLTNNLNYIGYICHQVAIISISTHKNPRKKQPSALANIG